MIDVTLYTLNIYIIIYKDYVIMKTLRILTLKRLMEKAETIYTANPNYDNTLSPFPVHIHKVRSTYPIFHFQNCPFCHLAVFAFSCPGSVPCQGKGGVLDISPPLVAHLAIDSRFSVYISTMVACPAARVVYVSASRGCCC